MTAVAEIDDELADVFSRGLRMEILSYRIMLEEPDGASKISQALNLGNDIALATAETTAIAAVSETITFAIANSAFTARAARGVAFEAIKSSCKAELRAFTEKEDFVELFDFIVNLGANNADYIPQLVEFLSVWVDSGKKRLSLSAFKEVNKISIDFPRSKVAVVMRAYWKDPDKQKYCPAPESLWSRVQATHMKKLESLLFYFSITLRDAFSSMETRMAQKLKTEASIGAADAFIAYVPQPGKTAPSMNHEEAMLRVTLDMAEAVVAHLKAPLPAPRGGDEWIDYEAVKKKVDEQKAKEKAEAEALAVVTDKKNAPPLQATVIQFDSDGNALDKQSTRNTGTDKDEVVELPWKAWISSAVGKDMDLERAFMGTVNLIMHGLHSCDQLREAPVRLEYCTTTKKVRSFATRDIEPGELQVPPCAPGSGSKLGNDPNKPNGQPISVIVYNTHTAPEKKRRALQGKQPEGVDGATAVTTTTTTYYIYADTKLPQWEYVADPSILQGNTPRRAMQPFDGKEVMHPFWLISRMTDKDLKTKNLDVTPSKKAKFNCEITTIQHGVVTTGLLMTKKQTLRGI